MISAFGVEDSRLSKADGDQPAPPHRKVRTGPLYTEGVAAGGIGGVIAANAEHLKDLNPIAVARRARAAPHLTGMLGGVGVLGGALGAHVISRHRKRHPEKYQG